MEYLELLLKFFSDNPNTGFATVAMIGQFLLWLELRAWKRELLAIKVQLLSLVSLHCDRWPSDMRSLLVDPTLKQIEQLEKKLEQ